jgi:nucleotide-binding universal stress UspA family protein
VLGSGRPTLLLPSTFDPERALGRRIALGWNATPEAARAIWDAMPLLTAAEEVWVLVVDQDRHDADFKDTRGEDLARHLARYGVKVGVRLFRATSGDVSRVLREALNELSADLLVLGAYGHPRISELLFGGVTQWALREAHIPTLLSR